MIDTSCSKTANPSSIAYAATAVADDRIVYASGEIKPGIRTPHILEGTMIP